MSYNIPIFIKRELEINRRPLAHAVEEAVRFSFANAARLCNGRAGEVDKVLQFFIEGVDVIENHFNAILRPVGIEVSIASIFTHQTPYVLFSTTAAPNSRCELADLCILASYDTTLDDPAGGIGNALFLQAKDTFTAPPNDRQRQLYEAAYAFQYDRPTELKTILPDLRQLPPKDASALSYWEFATARTSLRWSYSPAQREPFGSAIVDFLAGEAGYGFRIPQPGEESWSRIIFDLLQVTATACANRANLNVRDRKRGSGAVIRRLFNQIGRANAPFLVRNSLGKILNLYGPELAELGRKIEKAPKDSFDKYFTNAGGDSPEDIHKEPPPPLGNDREYDGDGNGGAGNIILIQFSRRG